MSILGMESDAVTVVSHHDSWAAEYTREAADIRRTVGPIVLEIQHVGSTAIPGVPAKPILDLLVGVRDFEEARCTIELMQRLGYEYRGEYGIRRRHYFVKGQPRTHHLHMVEVGGENWMPMIQFRDLLLRDAQAAGIYATEKQRLAAEYPNDRAAYQEQKGRVIEQVLRRSARLRGELHAHQP